MAGFRIPVILLVISLFTVAVSATLQGAISAHFKHLRPVADEISRAALAHQFTIAHNTIRAAFGLQPLKWNRTLARYARRWANQRINDCALQHSHNRAYGENMFWGLRKHWTPADVVKCWDDERAYYDPETNECLNGKVCGHYTQIIWKTTEQLGCGHVTCNNGKGHLYVCSYYPPGNFYFRGPFGGKFAKSVVYPPP